MLCYYRLWPCKSNHLDRDSPDPGLLAVPVQPTLLLKRWHGMRSKYSKWSEICIHNYTILHNHVQYLGYILDISRIYLGSTWLQNMKELRTPGPTEAILTHLRSWNQVAIINCGTIGPKFILVSTQEASNNKKHGCGEWEKTHTKTASSWCSWGAGETDAAKLDIYSIVYWMNPFMSATGPGTNHFSTHFVVHGSKPGNHLGCASLKNMDISIDQ